MKRIGLKSKTILTSMQPTLNQHVYIYISLATYVYAYGSTYHDAFAGNADWPVEEDVLNLDAVCDAECAVESSSPLSIDSASSQLSNSTMIK